MNIIEKNQETVATFGIVLEESASFLTKGRTTGKFNEGQGYRWWGK